jgi:hypothetical protein
VDEGLRAFQHFMDSGPGLSAWLIALPVMLPLIVFLHELGHAVVARRLLGGEVLAVVGSEEHGAVRFRLAGIDFSISPLVAIAGRGGYCRYHGFPSARETIAISLAGPGATALGLAVAVAALPQTSGLVHDLMRLTIFWSATGLLASLVPLTTTHGPNDGRTALDAARHLGGAPVRLTVPTGAAPVEARPLASATSPLCLGCGHRRDEHVDLATGRRGACQGQDYDFQALAAHRCACAEYV